MLRRVQVESTGDSDFIPGQMVDKFQFQDQNAKVLAEGGEPTTAKPILLGVTRASLLTDSFLSAASFQETTRVLTQAAVSGAQDWLQGLKENVIIGRLIPARVEIPGMEELLKPQPIPEIEAVSPGGWLGSSNDGGNSLNEALSLDSESENDSDISNIFASHEEPASDVELEENDEGPDDAPESELHDEENEDPDLNLVGSEDISADAASRAFGEEDGEGIDEPNTGTDSEGDE